MTAAAALAFCEAVHYCCSRKLSARKALVAMYAGYIIPSAKGGFMACLPEVQNMLLRSSCCTHA
eukprot:365817-Chlamydomonas_euryale.AAC.38